MLKMFITSNFSSAALCWGEKQKETGLPVTVGSPTLSDVSVVRLLGKNMDVCFTALPLLLGWQDSVGGVAAALLSLREYQV